MCNKNVTDSFPAEYKCNENVTLRIVVGYHVTNMLHFHQSVTKTLQFKKRMYVTKMLHYSVNWYYSVTNTLHTCHVKCNRYVTLLSC